ncbi:uncharacterized protein BX664DRAFT_389194 [Halteromyces radiatus]|uniref:uncharacterized protein n=1 Tax=Halteromyces radiatus TaxID=101107 RepID=UPI00221FAAB7|nr:uncharacterized protein BX664DRAFT_389194 [Halteromyces radiatus]KAI8078825.1 hypothetical protein BX664DRAFT_389194 [Halteromyces radiatus]
MSQHLNDSSTTQTMTGTAIDKINKTNSGSSTQRQGDTKHLKEQETTINENDTFKGDRNLYQTNGSTTRDSTNISDDDEAISSETSPHDPSIKNQPKDKNKQKNGSKNKPVSMTQHRYQFGKVQRQKIKARRINERRQQFQQQKQKDDATLSERRQWILDQQQHDKEQHHKERHQHWQQDGLEREQRGHALTAAIVAAEKCHLPTLTTTSSIIYQHNTIKPPPLHHECDLDPNDPDPWPEEKQHYLYMGRIIRMESLMEKRKAMDKGIKYELPVYNPIGLPRRKPAFHLSNTSIHDATVKARHSSSG